MRFTVDRWQASHISESSLGAIPVDVAAWLSSWPLCASNIDRGSKFRPLVLPCWLCSIAKLVSF